MKSADELPMLALPWEATLRMRCLELAAEFRAAATPPAAVMAMADEFFQYVSRDPAGGEPRRQPSPPAVTEISPDTSAAAAPPAEPGRSPESRAADAGDTARKGPGSRSGHPIRDQKP